ncbi:hypothetical protein EDD11_010386 [Mortierella claussenii]|nr:hypothetical protein EDD11_010386 [Mortierella claussenii]
MSHQRQTSSGSAYDPASQQYYHPQHPQQQQQQQYHMGMPSIGQVPAPPPPPPPPLQHHHDPSLAHHQPPMQQAHMHMLQSFWMNQMHEVENVPQDFKLHHLPLARIKKVMKTDEDVKMISAEAPMIFDKGCEIFITELTLRAWIHAEENKRRTLQRSDIAAAITKTDMFDFLIDIVPREEFKVAKEHKSSATSSVAAATAAEHRRSQESFSTIGSTVPSAGNNGPGGMSAGFEGYGYPYGVVENGSFAMPPGEAMDPYQQQQIQLQYMRAQMAQQGGHPQPHPQQRYDFQGQPPPQQHPPHDGGSEGPSHLPPDAW